MLSSPEKCVENYPVSYSLEVCQYDLHSNSEPHTHWQDTGDYHDSSLEGERAAVLLVLVIQLHVVPLSSLNSNLFLYTVGFNSNATLRSNTISVTALKGILVHPSPENM
jgi:hypothetical protein